MPSNTVARVRGPLRPPTIRVSAGAIGGLVRVAGPFAGLVLGVLAGLLRENGFAVELSADEPPPRGEPEVLVRVPLPVMGEREAMVDVFRAIAEWRALFAPREVLLPGSDVFCAGGDCVVAAVEQALGRHGPPVFVAEQLLAATATPLGHGVIRVPGLTAVPDGAVAVFSAHGADCGTVREAETRGITLAESQCLRVSAGFAPVRRYATGQDRVYLIGHGRREEPPAAALPGSARLPPLALVPEDPAGQVSAGSRTAARALAAESDVVLVAGPRGAPWLVEVVRSMGVLAWPVGQASEIRPHWLSGVGKLGIALAAEVPGRVVDEIVQLLSGFGPVTVRERTGSAEDALYA